MLLLSPSYRRMLVLIECPKRVTGKQNKGIVQNIHFMHNTPQWNMRSLKNGSGEFDIEAKQDIVGAVDGEKQKRMVFIKYCTAQAPKTTSTKRPPSDWKHGALSRCLLRASISKHPIYCDW